MVIVAQLVRAPDCGSGGRGFEPRLSPFKSPADSAGLFLQQSQALFVIVPVWNLIFVKPYLIKT